jgi:GTP cyclohydrolase I
MKDKLPDIQSKKINSVKLNRVGVSDVDFPIYVKTKKGEKALCAAKVNMYVSLRHHIKGINMSRLPRTLMKFRYTAFSRWVLWKFLYNLKKYSDTTDAYAEVKFKYFVDKVAPATKEKSVMAYNCEFIGHISDKNKYTFHLKVTTIGTSNCPCSKEISKYGAHGQRSEVTVTVETKHKRTVKCILS